MSKKVPFCLLTIFFIISCKKDVKQADPGPFFISYTTQGTYFYISPGNDYLLTQGTAMGTDAGGNHQFIPTTRFFQASPHNENIYRIGFLFSSALTGSTIDWAAVGNSIFQAKTYTICYTGVNYANFLEGLSCIGGATVYYTPVNGILHNSTAVIQPAGSYFVIDTVTAYHSVDARPNYNFDKIISGRFQCRVFDPENHAVYIDLSLGKFRMPVWKNGF